MPAASPPLTALRQQALRLWLEPDPLQKAELLVVVNRQVQAFSVQNHL